MYYPLKNFLRTNCQAWDLAAHPDQQGDKVAITAALQGALLNTKINGIRLYTNAYELKSTDNLSYKISPSERGYMMDEAIVQIKAKDPNFFVHLCYQHAPHNIINEIAAAGIKSKVYRHPGANPEDPASYSELAHDLEVLAGRGGKNVNVPDYPLFIPPNWWEPRQTMYKGKGFYNGLEGINEGDHDWGESAPMNGKQYAAAWYAYYRKIKNIDPSIVVSSSGVMTENPIILTDALATAAQKGWGTLFDVYQYHCYPWGWKKNIASALPPEMNMVPATEAIMAVPGDFLRMIGEWSPGDRHPKSNMGIRPFSSYNAEQISSYWGARAILGFMSTGLYSAYYFQMRQDYGPVNDNNPEQFATSNLFIDVSETDIRRRLTGDMFRQLAEFGEMVFDSKIINEPTKKVYKYKWNGKEFYAGWTVENVTLIVEDNGDGSGNSTNRASFTENKSSWTFPAGTRYELGQGDLMAQSAFAGGSIELSTKPVFVLADSSVVVPPIDPPIPPDPPPVTVTWEQVDRGYWKDKKTGKNKYFLVYENNIGKLAAIRCSSTYKPIEPIPTK